MKKKIKTIIAVLITITIIIMQMSYAGVGKANTSFMQFDKTGICSSDKLTITFNLSKIDYDNFTIKLDSTTSLESAYLSDTSNINLENNENDISIEIDKAKISLSKISLYYDAPSNIAVGNTIEFDVKVIATTTNESETNNETEAVTTEITVLEEAKTITVIEQKQDDSKEEENKNTDTKKTDEQNQSKGNTENDKDNSNNEKGKSQNAQKQDTIPSVSKSNMPSGTGNGNGSTSQSKTSIGATKVSSMNTGSSTQGATVTYNGSDNNYLSKLKIDGATLNTTFNKENTTYFITVKNTTSLKITATAEDSNADVCITGADNISTGENKVLISITAENGNVRYYRIFVTCEEG